MNAEICTVKTIMFKNNDLSTFRIYKREAKLNGRYIEVEKQ